MADEFFDKEGRSLHSNATTDVNSISSTSRTSRRPRSPSRPAAARREVQTASGDLNPARDASTTSSTTSSSSFTSAFDDFVDDNGEVNAVRFKGGQRQSFNVANRSSNHNSRGRGFQRGNQSRNRSSSRFNASSTASAPSRDSKVCEYHIKYGEDARSCREGCMMYSKHKSQAPKAQPGQRT